MPLTLKASCHNSSQRETLDWPTGPAAQQDLFDFTPLSVVAVVFQTAGVPVEKKTKHECANYI